MKVIFNKTAMADCMCPVDTSVYCFWHRSVTVIGRLQASSADLWYLQITKQESKLYVSTV
jgi:hypothetical protein